jgi:methionyl aminopeptidase
MLRTETIESNTNTSSNTKRILKYGNWNLEYDNKQKYIYKSDFESFDNGVFEQLDTSIVKTYDNINNETTDTINKLTDSDLEDFRRAAIIHKIARKKALTMLYTGAKLADLVDSVEDIILKLCRQDSKTYFLKGSPQNNMCGLAFPVGVNINNIVAHDSKLVFQNGKIDQRTFFNGDLVKVDIGVHVNGRIIDSAFSHIITNKSGVHDTNNIYNSVLEASRDSVFTAIKMAGPDQRLDEMSETIDEIIRSYEVDMAGESIPIKPVKGIGGHNIKQYQIHGGKLILSEPDYEIQGDLKMEEDEIYAIETYATTGMGIMTQNTELNSCTHFMEANKEDVNNNKKITKRDKKVFQRTDFYRWLQTRQGLPFSSAWIDTKAIPKGEKTFKMCINSQQVLAYPPLFDENNSVVAQFEHTIHINDGSVEIFSLGEDY